jgi:hypothetical protein
MLLPNTLAEHKAIAATASFVRARGTQAEILLKVKQSANPKFGFLVELEHPLHAYYDYLRDTGFEHDPNAPAAVPVPVVSSSPPVVPVVVPTVRKGPPGMSAPPGMRAKAPPGVSSTSSSSTSSANSAPQPPTALPPQDIMTIIDNLAPFVVKNGSAFEDMVREKDPASSGFLNPGNGHHTYYLYALAKVKYQQANEAAVKAPTSAIQGQIAAAQATLEAAAAPAATPAAAVPEEPKRSASAEKEKRKADELESKRARERILARMPKGLRRERSRSRSKSKSRDRDRGSKSRGKSKSKESKSKDRDRDRDKKRDKGRDRDRDRDKKRDKGRDRSRSRSRDRKEDNSRKKKRRRSRSRSLSGASKASKVEKVAPVASDPWKAAVDASSGKTYYYNATTRETTWSKPSGH